MRAHTPIAGLASSTVAIAIAALIALPRAAAGQAQPSGVDGCPSDYTIGPEDVLDVAVWGNSDITRTVPVRPDGKISLPLLNDVQAAGMTPMQLRESLATSLARYLASPNVSVIVREVHSFKVTVIGEVKATGRYEVRSRTTVLDVLAMAGGPTDYAARDRILVLRQHGSSTEQIPFSLERVLAKHAASPSTTDRDLNVCLAPGDIIVVR
jgi:polysaccharide export outer membrane protein